MSPVLMPQLGETVAEGKILTWFKSVGDRVERGEALFEVETDKVTIEVEATEAGLLGDILVRDGETAKVGAVVATIAPAGAGSAARSERSAVLAVTATLAVQAKASSARSTARVLMPFAEVATPTENFGRAATHDGIVRITPLARRLASQHEVAIDEVVALVRRRNGSRVFSADVREVMSAPGTSPEIAPAAPHPGADKDGRARRLSSIRKRTAERLTESWRTIPHVFQAVEVDFTAVAKARSAARERFASAGLPLTYLPFIARAVCLAISEFRDVNAVFDGDSLRVSSEINLGIAVDLAHNGLVVPVVRGAGDLTVAGLAKAIHRQVEKARSGKLSLDDLQGGTYSITNNGAFGTLFTAPIINAPQVAILSTDAISKRPAVVSTPEGDFVAPRLTGIVGQSFDHRAFDGAYAAAFLGKLKAILQQPDWSQELVA